MNYFTFFNIHLLPTPLSFPIVWLWLVTVRACCHFQLVLNHTRKSPSGSELLHLSQNILKDTRVRYFPQLIFKIKYTRSKVLLHRNVIYSSDSPDSRQLTTAELGATLSNEALKNITVCKQQCKSH